MNALAMHTRLAAYNTWMNRRLYSLCADLTDTERRRDRGAFFKSIHGTLNHILVADHGWLLRCTRDLEKYSPRDAAGDVIRLTALDQILHDDFEQLRVQRERADQLLEDWIASLSNTALDEPVVYRSRKGEHSHPLWWCVTHLFNHQTHHRGQLTTLLYQAGCEHGVTDFIEFIRGDYDMTSV
jgi:uncharacterized damage-inducible protein DinB